MSTVAAAAPVFLAGGAMLAKARSARPCRSSARSRPSRSQPNGGNRGAGIAARAPDGVCLTDHGRTQAMAAADPPIITVAITGSAPRKEGNPALPVAPAEQVESTHAAYEARATWSAAGLGRHRFEAAAWAPETGGHRRTGLEGNMRLDRDTLAPSNAAPVERVAGIAAGHGRPVAAPEQAHEMLGPPTPA